MDSRTALSRKPVAPEGVGNSRLETVLAYHQRTKHRLDRYAAGPETLDWSGQPDPFRTFGDVPRIRLALGANTLLTPFAALADGAGIVPRPLNLANLAILLELSLGLSAWKEYGPDRWALRCNPSSGNLHPTEGYVIGFGIADLPDGVYHYLSRDHLLEQRCRFDEPDSAASPRLLIGLSSVHWREAWKYGERAFRYCQLDTGHAIGSLRYAAAALGWNARVRTDLGSGQVARWLGLDRREDFSGAEPEDPELILEVFQGAMPDASSCGLAPPTGQWTGRANVLDRHPMYSWPVIDEVAEASQLPDSWGAPSRPLPAPPGREHAAATVSGQSAATLIRQRRSAQRFDGKGEISAGEFFGLLARLGSDWTVPWDVWSFSPSLHPVFFVHRVAGLTPGVYLLVRDGGVMESLRHALQEGFEWVKPDGCPDHLNFFRLAAADCKAISRTLNCHQAIASDSAFALGMLAEFSTVLDAEPARYRQLYWEAGLMGQVLYLEAEAAGLRGTGIGCYFDDAFHELLGLKDTHFQSLYHFTVGMPLTDTRIMTLPPYDRDPNEDSAFSLQGN